MYVFAYPWLLKLMLAVDHCGTGFPARSCLSWYWLQSRRRRGSDTARSQAGYVITKEDVETEADNSSPPIAGHAGGQI